MQRPRAHIFALAIAAAMLLLAMSGAAVTSLHDQPTQAGYESFHLIFSIVVFVLILALAIVLARTKSQAAGWTALAIATAEGGLGHHASGPVTGTLHAILAAVLFAALSAIVLSTSRTWSQEPELVRDYGWPSLRFLSSATAVLVAIQVGYGAGFRHSAVGVFPHLIGALIVALFIMIVGAFVSNQFPRHATLKPIAVALMIITGIQVFLGMTAFIMRMMNIAISMVWLAVRVAHVATGSLTLAAIVMLAIEIRRDVLPRETNPCETPQGV
jgi:hypothetical protein